MEEMEEFPEDPTALLRKDSGRVLGVGVIRCPHAVCCPEPACSLQKPACARKRSSAPLAHA